MKAKCEFEGVIILKVVGIIIIYRLYINCLLIYTTFLFSYIILLIINTIHFLLILAIIKKLE